MLQFSNASQDIAFPLNFAYTMHIATLLSKYPQHQHNLHTDLDDDDLSHMVRKRPSLASFFNRSSTRSPSDASTPSASRSQSRSQSPSPTSSFFIDHDPFAKLESPVSPTFRNSSDIPALEPPSPSPSATEFIQSDQSPRSPLSPRLTLPKNDLSRSKTPKLVRNTPSLPSLSELARAGGSSYASAFASKSPNAASKRFPLEPWDLVQSSQSGLPDPDDDYGQLQASSRFTTIRGPPAFLHNPSFLRNPISEAPEPPEPPARKRQSSPVPERVAVEQDPHTASVRWTHPYHEARDSYHQFDADPNAYSVQALARDFPWAGGGDAAWDIVHDSKDALENELDTEDEEQSDDRHSAHAPVIHSMAWQQGHGQNGAVQGGGDHGEDEDTPSDYGSDDYGSDRGQGGGYGGGGSGRERGDGDDDALGRSAFSDDQGSESESESSEEDSEDNIPLAQRIPGALQAQKSIRIQDKAERERKRRERHAQKHARPRVAPPAAVKAARPGAITADDLTQRLLQVQADVPSASQGRSPETSQQQTLRGARSLHRPAAREPNARRASPEAGVSWRPTAARSRNHSLTQPAPPPVSPAGLPPVPVARRATSAHRRGPSDPPHGSPQPRFQPQELLSPQMGDAHWRRSHEAETGRRASPDVDAGRRRSHDPPERDTAVTRARTISPAPAPTHRVLQRARTSATRAPPPAPQPAMPMPLEVKRHARDGSATQHRVFIGDMQRFNTVEIGAQTRARDVLDLVDAQGELRGAAAAQPGGWMLWELAQDFGMERPLREYELPAEVYASWNSNMRLNAFMIKKTPLANILARRAMPSSSPRCSGYVQWESKRGKWNKRWMELREHSLWLSKRDNGKDETFLCSLSNFDCYYVSRLHKAPRPFVFAVKATENLTLFENPADYLHVFSCDQQQGQQWMECIMLARSYVLHKERTVLFSAPTVPSAAVSTTRTPAQSPNPSRAAAPLVNVNTLAAPAGLPAAKKSFQSGSLLAKTSV